MMHMLGKLENDQVNTLKKIWAGVPPYIMIFRSLPALFLANIVCVCGGGGDRSGWGTYTTLNYWNLHQSTTPGLIDKIVVKIDSQNKSVPLNVPISWIQSHQGLSI